MTYRLLILISLIVITLRAQAQTSNADTLISRATAVASSTDSLLQTKQHRLDSSAKMMTHQMDSLKSKGLPMSKYQKKLDSINTRLQSITSVNHLSQKVNGGILKTRDSLRQRINNNGTTKVKHRIDSVRDSAQMKLEHKTQKLKNKIGEGTKHIDSLSAKIKDPTGNLKLPASDKLNTTLDTEIAKGTELSGVTGTNVNAGIPNTALQSGLQSGKNLSLPQTGEIGNGLEKIGGLPQQEIGELQDVKEINGLKNDTKEIGQLEKQVDGYQKEIKGVKKMDKDSLAKTADKSIEQMAAGTEYGKELKTGTAAITAQKNALEQYKDMLEKIKKENAPKEGEAVATKELADHFAGQEAKLQAGIAQLDKLKKKYHTIPDSRYLPKHAPNEMKGKPFKGRLVPGLSFQAYQSNATGFDISPYLMYRFTGRLRAGIGGSWRFATEGRWPYVSDGQVQTARVMADLRAIGTFYFHIEGEWIHYSGTRNVFKIPSDPPMGGWGRKLNVGILKTYKISRRIDGQAQVLYNATDWSNFPQNKNTSVRFGIEYKLGAKKAKAMPDNVH